MLDHSLNLARRLSARNEPELLPFDFNNVEVFTKEKGNQDDGLSTSSTSSSPPSYSLNYCEAIVAKITSINGRIPEECKEYPSVREALIRRRDTERHDHAVAFEGMHSGQAVSAMAARERGHLNPCQIQKRFTNRKASDRRVW